MKRITWNRFTGPLPPNTKSVMRPTKYGNPFKVSDFEREESLRLFDLYLDRCLLSDPHFLDPLKGYDLACACKQDEPCHGDILLARIKTNNQNDHGDD